MRARFILEKEIRSYFGSMILCVVVAIFLALSGYFFYTDVLYFNIANMGSTSLALGMWQYFFQDLRYILLLVVPLLTMRLFAEEKKLGTMELLMTYPFKESDLLLGKLASALLLLALMLGLTLVYPILLATIWRPEVRPLLAGYLGVGLLGFAFIACGLFISSLTENQIVAAAGTYGLLTFFWFLAWNEAVAEPGLLNLLVQVSFLDHFYNFARGVIELRDVAFFLLFGLFFLYLTMRSLEARKGKRGYWVNLAVGTVVVLGVAALLEAFTSRHNLRFDLTLDRNFTLGLQTRRILGTLRKELRVTAFYEPERRWELNDRLRLYAAQSSRFRYELLDLDRNPARARQYGATAHGTTAVEYGEKRAIIPYPNEERMLQAILEVTRSGKKVIYFLKGHGENGLAGADPKRSCSLLREALETENYRAKELLLIGEKGVPEDCAALVIGGPRQDLLERELEGLGNFLQRGGRLFLMVDPHVALPGMEGLLHRYGILLGKGIVVDPNNRLFAGDPFTAVIPFYRKHPITRDFEIATVYPLARRVDVEGPAGSDSAGRSVQVLAKSDQGSWEEMEVKGSGPKKIAFEAGRDREGPVPVGVVAEVAGKGKGRGRLVVLGDSDFAANFYVNLLGNKDLFLNAVSWLTEAEDLISPRRKRREHSFSFLTVAQARRLFWPSVVLEPAAFLLAGVAVFLWRRVRG